MSLKRNPPTGDVRRVASIGQNLRGVITNKCNRTVQFESFLERTLLLCFERDRTVLDYRSQPETLEGVDGDGRRFHYTPDFFVWRAGNIVEIHEVTLTSRREHPHSQRREQLARETCLNRGWRYQVHTEQTLPNGSEVANLLALYRYRPVVYADPTIVAAVCGCLAQQSSITFGALSSLLIPSLNRTEAQLTPVVCHLLWHGTLATDRSQLLWEAASLRHNMPMWLNEGGQHDA